MPRVWLRVVCLGLALLGARPAVAQDLSADAASPAETTVPGSTGAAGTLQTAPVPDSGGASTELPLPAAAPQPAGDSVNLQAFGTPGPWNGSPVSRPVNGAEAGQLRDYGRQVGQDWLKDTLGVDLQSMRVVWDPNTWRFVTAGSLAARNRAQNASAPQSVSPGAAGSGTGLSLQLVQTDDLTRLAQGVRDVPYNAEVKGAFKPVRSLAAINTSLKIPLSPYDAWRADASMPLDWDGTDDLPWWWRGLGLGRSLALHSGINSRLGFNQVEAGMKTQWNPGFWGLWNLDYAWDLRYGEGSGESSNWLKVSKQF